MRPISLDLALNHLAQRYRYSSNPQLIAILDPNSAAIDEAAPLAHLGSSTLEDWQSSLQRSEQQFQLWRESSISNRVNSLDSIAKYLREHAASCSDIIRAESAKNKKEALSEVEYAASYFDWYRRQLELRADEFSPLATGATSGSKVDAVGVTLAITPWNFPLAMLARKIAPAIAAGCSVISKPSELTPFSALLLSEIVNKATGLDDLVQVLLVRNEELGDFSHWIENSSSIRKLSFTGSTRVGRQLYQKCALSIKRLSLELGGNAAFVVAKDANIDRVIASLHIAKLRFSGQTCIAANRIYVENSRLQEFIHRWSIECKTYRCGSSWDDTSNFSPLISQRQTRRYLDILHTAQLSGETLSKRESATEFPCASKTPISSVLSSESRFQSPATILHPNWFERPAHERQVEPFFSEEIFGPLCNIYPFDDLEDVIQENRVLETGLASYLDSDNPAEIEHYISRTPSGLFGINTAMISSAKTSFGGVRQSGLGREGGPNGLDEYLEEKYVRYQID